jgi:hypothetical protein
MKRLLAFGAIFAVTALASLTTTSQAKQTGRTDVLPWVIERSAVENAIPGSVVTIENDAGIREGTFLPIQIDGWGAAAYTHTLKYGSESIICSEAELAFGCVGTAPACTGSDCPVALGNLTGPTRVGIEYRMTNTSRECDDFEEAFDRIGNGKYRIEGHCDPLSDTDGSLRVLVVPVADEFGSRDSIVTITGFAVLYLEGMTSGACAGASCGVDVRFVELRGKGSNEYPKRVGLQQ